MKKLLTIICCGIISGDAAAQNNPSSPCSSLECNQFDFWLGDWNLTYNDTVHAFNKITKEMDGCVIYEHFDDPSQKKQRFKLVGVQSENKKMAADVG